MGLCRVRQFAQFYNVSFDLENMSKEFKPRIPENKYPDEDAKVPRICLCEHVPECMLGIGPGRRDLRVGARFILRTAILDYRDNNLVNPYILDKLKLVPDAKYTQEYWYLDSLKFNDVLICEITDFDFEFCIAWPLISIEDCAEVISKYTSEVTPDGCKDSEDLWKKFCAWCGETKSYEIFDDADRDIEKLPLAQNLKINRLKYKILKSEDLDCIG